MKKFIQQLIPPLTTKAEVSKCNKDLYKITRFFLYGTVLCILIFIGRLGYYGTLPPENFSSEIATSSYKSVAFLQYKDIFTEILEVSFDVSEYTTPLEQGFADFVIENPKQTYIVYGILYQLIPHLFFLCSMFVVTKLFKTMWQKEIPFGGECSTSVMFLALLFWIFTYYRNCGVYYLLMLVGVCNSVSHYLLDPVSTIIATLLIGLSHQMKYASHLQEESDDTV
ncbi:MAG: hypothetical protein R3Y63_12945 [Eubacteriales bacterium]